MMLSDIEQLHDPLFSVGLGLTLFEMSSVPLHR
jgi:hypothetical protein